MCVLIFSTTFVWNISNSKKKWANFDYKINMYIGFGVYHPWFFSDFMKLCVSQQIFKIYSYVNVEISVNSSHKHN